MTKKILAAATALALSSGAAAASAADAPAAQHVVTPPRMGPFDSSLLGSLYPKPAVRAGVIGTSWLRCHVTPRGDLDTCKLLADRPDGWGAGDAALKFSVSLHMTPATVDGVAVDGSVIVPVNWDIEDRDVYAPPSRAEALAAYPAPAAAAAISGGAVVACMPQRGGSLNSCKVLSEFPQGLGFGQAATGLVAPVADRWWAQGRPEPVKIEVRWYSEVSTEGQAVRPEAVMAFTDSDTPHLPAGAPALPSTAPKEDCAQGRDTPVETIVLACTQALLAPGELPSAERALLLADRGQAQLLRGDAPRAKADFAQALALAPDLRDALFGDVDARIELGDPEGALADLDRATAAHPDDAMAWTKRSALMLWKGDYDRAVADAARAIGVDPNAHGAYINRSAALEAQGHAEAAAADLSKAIALKPDEARDYQIRAGFWLRTKDLDRALADLDQAIRLSPKDAHAFALRAVAWRQKGKLDQALADADQAVALDPKQVAMRRSIRIEAGDWTGALADADAEVAQAPEHASAFNSRCWVRALWGRELDQAQRDCNRAIQLNPKNASAWDSFGFVQLRQKAYAQAIASLDHALELRPKTASSLYVRGLAKLKSGRAAEGHADIAAAQALDPSVAGTYTKAGVEPQPGE